MTLRFLAPTFLAVSLASPAAAQCELLWSNSWDNIGIGPSHVTPSEDFEVADDFELIAEVHRILANGNGPNCCGESDVLGAWVRFYDWSGSGPGTLQAEYWFDADDENLEYGDLPATLDIVLPAPFQATGRHFLSVQLVFGEATYWDWWAANLNGPDLTPAWSRNKGTGGAWQPYLDFFGKPVDADVNFTLYGDDGTGALCEEWIEIESPNASDRHSVARAIAALATDDVWSVGTFRTDEQDSRTQGFSMHWDGGAWTLVPTPNPEPCGGCGHVQLRAVDGVASDDVWAAGTQRMQHPQDGFLGFQPFVVQWDGGAWTEVPAPVTPAGSSGAGVAGIEAIGADDVWFVGDWVDPGQPFTQPALALHWDGSGFTVHPTPAFSSGGHGLEAVSAVATDDVWAVGGGGDSDWAAFSYIIHWDGSSWSHVPAPTVGIIQRLFDVVAIASDDVWVTGQAHDGTSIVPIVQHWNGAGWTTVPSPEGGGSLAAFASDDVWVAGGGFAHWDGVEWTAVPGLGCVPGPSLVDMAVVPGVDEAWAAGRRISFDLRTLTARWRPRCDELGTRYCTPAVPNSTGVPAEIRAFGSEIAAERDLLLEAAQMPPGKFGYFLTSLSSGFVANPGGSQGNLCLGGQIGRFAKQVQDTGVEGRFAIDVDTTAIPVHPPVTIQAGDTWHFQAWYRDNHPGPTSNFTDAVGVAFL